MQSSFNVIKNNSVVSGGKKEIETSCEDIKVEKITTPSIQANYENLATSILDNARSQSEQIITETYRKAQDIEKEAYERGYENGEKQGYSDSYDRAYEEHVIKAQREAEQILNQAHEVADYADKILFNAKAEYERYLIDKKNEIKDLILEITGAILIKEVQAEDAINEMVINALSQVKNGKTFIVKCHSQYVNELKEYIEGWKNQLTFKCEIFVVEDNTLGLGNVVIEKDNGHIEVGIDIGFSRLKEIIQEND